MQPDLTDEQLMKHIHARLPGDLQQRLIRLQQRSSSGELSREETDEFDRLLHVVHASSVLKAHALLLWKQRHGQLPGLANAGPGWPFIQET
jgi:hypothetical protein